MKVKAFKYDIFKSSTEDYKENCICGKFDCVYAINPFGDYEFDLSKPDEIPDNLVTIYKVETLGEKIFIPYKYKDYVEDLLSGNAFIYKNDASFYQNFGINPILLFDCGMAE